MHGKKEREIKGSEEELEHERARETSKMKSLVSHLQALPTALLNLSAKHFHVISRHCILLYST